VTRSTEVKRAKFLDVATRYLKAAGHIAKGRLEDQVRTAARDLDPAEVEALLAAARRQVGFESPA